MRHILGIFMLCSLGLLGCPQSEQVESEQLQHQAQVQDEPPVTKEPPPLSEREQWEQDGYYPSCSYCSVSERRVYRKLYYLLDGIHEKLDTLEKNVSVMRMRVRRCR